MQALTLAVLLVAVAARTAAADEHAVAPPAATVKVDASGEAVGPCGEAVDPCCVAVEAHNVAREAFCEAGERGKEGAFDSTPPGKTDYCVESGVEVAGASGCGAGVSDFAFRPQYGCMPNSINTLQRKGY